MPFALLIALAASLGIHAAALFLTDVDLGPEPEPMPLMAELRPLPPPLPPDCESYHAYQPVEICAGSAPQGRDAVAAGLKKFNVYARRYFHPLLPDCAPDRDAQCGGDLPVARRVARQILTLPIHHDRADDAVHRICDILLHLLSGTA